MTIQNTMSDYKQCGTGGEPSMVRGLISGSGTLATPFANS